MSEVFGEENSPPLCIQPGCDRYRRVRSGRGTPKVVYEKFCDMHNEKTLEHEMSKSNNQLKLKCE